MAEPPTPIDEQPAEFGHEPPKHQLSCKVLFARYFFTALIFLFVLVSTALSKVCFVSIAAQLNININSSVGNEAGEKRRSVAFVQLVLVLCVPQAVTILKTLFLGVLGKTTKHFPWPTWPALLKVCSLSVRVFVHMQMLISECPGLSACACYSIYSCVWFQIGGLWNFGAV